ncbi:MAG: PQQ-binding-like beta-propeller repeat protein, partial [Cyclobacteriaceae bacterium]|nr:PQQ-binding-like beta-propeller repeat protein [Cyclobacteriaceae bacterium]
MNNREKQILAYRTAFIAGAFSLIVCIVMLLNFWQLKTSDPLESEALKHLVERLQEDTRNEELKVEIRNLDLMTRNAFFTNQWQIRSGAFLLIGGIITMAIGLRIYFSSRASIKQPDSEESQLDIELLISRRWIVYTVSIIFALALVASFLSIDHLSETYALTEVTDKKDDIPVQEIKPIQEGIRPVVEADDEIVSEITESTVGSTIPEVTESEIQKPEKTEDAPEELIVKESSLVIPGRNEIIKNFPAFRGPYGLGISYHKNIPVKWDGATGENVLWKIPVPLPGFNSPVIWGNLLFITGADKDNQSVYCYDMNSGKLNWEHKV